MEAALILARAVSCAHASRARRHRASGRPMAVAGEGAQLDRSAPADASTAPPPAQPHRVRSDCSRIAPRRRAGCVGVETAGPSRLSAAQTVRNRAITPRRRKDGPRQLVLAGAQNRAKPPGSTRLSETRDCHCSTTRVSAKPAALSTHCPSSRCPPTPDLTLPLAQQTTLTRGPGSHPVTLMDAAILVRDLDQFRQARPKWDRAAEIILVAATTGTRAHITEATRQLLVTVERENWWRG